MKKVILGLIFAILASGTARAVSVTAQVSYSYSGVAAKFRLYQDGAQVCEVPAPAKDTGVSCPVTLPATGTASFALSAVDSSGIESPRSAPYVFTVPAVPSVVKFTVSYDYTVKP